MPRDPRVDRQPGDVFKGYNEASISHFRVFVDVVGARTIWFDVVTRYNRIESRRMPKDEFVAWVAEMEVLNVA